MPSKAPGSKKMDSVLGSVCSSARMSCGKSGKEKNVLVIRKKRGKEGKRRHGSENESTIWRPLAALHGATDKSPT